MHQCTECGFVAKNAAGLKLHKKGSKCKKQVIAGIVATATDSIHAVKASAVKEVANQMANAAVFAADDLGVTGTLVLVQSLDAVIGTGRALLAAPATQCTDGLPELSSRQAPVVDTPDRTVHCGESG